VYATPCLNFFYCGNLFSKIIWALEFNFEEKCIFEIFKIKIPSKITTYAISIVEKSVKYVGEQEEDTEAKLMLDEWWRHGPKILCS